jgi:hypothetical protein
VVAMGTNPRLPCLLISQIKYLNAPQMLRYTYISCLVTHEISSTNKLGSEHSVTILARSLSFVLVISRAARIAEKVNWA